MTTKKWNDLTDYLGVPPTNAPDGTIEKPRGTGGELVPDIGGIILRILLRLGMFGGVGYIVAALFGTSSLLVYMAALIINLVFKDTQKMAQLEMLGEEE